MKSSNSLKSQTFPAEMTISQALDRGTDTDNSNTAAIVAIPPTFKLKRSFTLARNPLWRRSPAATSPTITTNENGDFKDKVGDGGGDDANSESKASKRIFRRPSFRKLITRIAQHISTSTNVGAAAAAAAAAVAATGDSRVPPLLLQTWGTDETPGVTGLKNHGNTCFINAVLQCISHTDVLAEYFVLDRYKVDLLKRNKLNSKKFGTRGELTEQLATVLKALWACQYTPELSTGFKQIVERHGNQYKGNQQHDALEFLQWLLDKVHEDLNTATKRKYKSIKTSGRPDDVIAAETLENHKRCNNSFIQGVFQAQYRSSLRCARCHTQSNTFDPFQCISVQLPQFTKQSIFVTVLYTSQQPRQVRIGVSITSGATIAEVRDILESDTSIAHAQMLLMQVDDAGFQRTFTDTQSVSLIGENDEIYCVEVAPLKDLNDVGDDVNNDQMPSTAYILLCWINVEVIGGDAAANGTVPMKRFGSPYTMQVSRETNYDDLQKLILKEMAPILHDDILTDAQPRGIFKVRIVDVTITAASDEPACYLEPDLEHPLFMEAVEQVLALCSEVEGGGPPHLKLVLEFDATSKSVLIADDGDVVEEHSSVKQLRSQSVQGGVPLTLQECLRDYTEAETLTDAWRCPHCQQFQPVVKTLDIWSLPDILIVHFKRFRQQSLRGCNSAKLTTMVDFPVDNFDMSPHLATTIATGATNTNVPVTLNLGGGSCASSDSSAVSSDDWASPWKKAKKHQPQINSTSTLCPSNNSSNNEENIYDLYGVCYHHGSDLETGHYTAACRNPFDNQWYLYDDSKVTNLTSTTQDVNSVLVNNAAYILFYQRRNGCFFISNNNNNNINHNLTTNGNSNSSSSAASTSSSGAEHWIARMPKFQPPKPVKPTTKSKSEELITGKIVVDSNKVKEIIQPKVEEDLPVKKNSEEDSIMKKICVDSVVVDEEMPDERKPEEENTENLTQKLEVVLKEPSTT